MIVEVCTTVPGAGETKAGTLEAYAFRGGQQWEFRYDRDYLAAGHPALSPELPVLDGPVLPPGGRPAFSTFADAGPDSWGRRIIARSRPGERLGELDLLLAVQDEYRQGAVRFVVDGTYLAKPDSAASTSTLAELASSAERFADGHADASDIGRLLRVGTASGGARPKASVRDESGHLWLAKFYDPRDTYAVLRWELACLAMAEDAGIHVPERRVVDLDGRRRIVLLLRRFDRDAAGRRIPYASARTLLVAAGAEPTYEAVAAELSTVAADPNGARLETVRRAALNVLVGNLDDHDRNHGFLLTERGWTWSPAFDITPTDVLTDPNLPLYQGAPAIRELDDVYELARRLDVDAEDAISRCLDVVAGWRDYAARSGIPDEEIRRIGRVAFEHADELTRPR